MLVPSVAADGRAEQLDEPDAALDESPGDQAFAGEDLRRQDRDRRGRRAAGGRRLAVEKFTSSGTAVCMRKASS